MTLDAWLAAHPHLAAAVTAVAAWHLPTPRACWRVLAAVSKGTPMPSISPFIQALEADLPALLRGTKAIAKALLDTIYTTGTPEEKAAALTAQLEPGFNKGLTELGLPGWALGLVDGVFANLVKATVLAVETVEPAVAK